MTDDIQPLTALEAIRFRPAMYVRPDVSGSIPDQLLQASLCHPLAELCCGTASQLSITLNGLTAMVTDNGAGWPVHYTSRGQRLAETFLSTLNACRDHKDHSEMARSLCQITLPVVVALSVRFTLDVYREGGHWRQVYQNGVAVAPLTCIGDTTSSGTTLSFSLDPRFCGDAHFSAIAFSAWLKELPPEIPQDRIALHSS